MKFIEKIKNLSSEEKALWAAIPAAALIIIAVFVEHSKMSADENAKARRKN